MLIPLFPKLFRDQASPNLTTTFGKTTNRDDRDILVFIFLFSSFRVLASNALWGRFGRAKLGRRSADTFDKAKYETDERKARAARESILILPVYRILNRLVHRSCRSTWSSKLTRSKLTSPAKVEQPDVLSSTTTLSRQPNFVLEML